jgi:O-Antigen ligase
VYSSDDLAGPSLPSWFLLPATGIFALLTLYFIMRTRGRAARFLMFACWLRYTLSSLHEFTYNEAIPGIKWVALGSLAIVGTGLLVLEKRRLMSRLFFPVALICGLMLVSAVLNKSIMSAFEPIVRFVIFVLIGVALWQALETRGSSVVRRLLLVFIQPLTYQVASIVLGVAKSGELDGSISYIGGYYHEELFSLIAVTCFFLIMFATRVGKFTRFAVSFAALAAIYLANYRTTMLAIVPIAAVALFTFTPRAFEPSQRSFARLMIVLGGIALMGVGVALEKDRFSDLSAITQGTSLIKPPETFSGEERRELSSRPYIWSTYIYAYAEAPMLQKIIGFGPDSWEGHMQNYAHNTIISFLYELGIAGVAAILLLWGSMFRLALTAEKRSRSLLIAGHVSFLVLNLATMAHWEVEGNILYGVLCGYTIAKARQARVTRLLVARYAARHRALGWRDPRPLSPAHVR